MTKQKRIKIRVLLILGVTIIFASSITPLIMMAVDNVRSLGEFAIQVGGESIEKGSTLLFMERVKAKAGEYSEAFSQAEKYLKIYKAQMESAFKLLPYYAKPDEQNIKYLSALSSVKNSKIISSSNKDNVNFWYWGDNEQLPETQKKDIDFFTLYYPFIKEIGSKNKFFYSSWLIFYSDKLFFYYCNSSDLRQIMPNGLGLESYANTLNYKENKWSQIYKDISGNTVVSIMDTIKGEDGKELGSLGIDVNINSIVSDAEKYSVINENSLPPDIRNSSVKPFSFILDQDLNIISFPLDNYSIFGFNISGGALNKETLNMKFDNSTHKELKKCVTQMKTEDSGVTFINLGTKGEYVITFAKITENNWIFGEVVPLDYLLAPVKETKAEISIITRDLMFALAIMAVMFFIVAVFLILVVFKEYLINPINNLTYGINDVIKSSFKKKLDEEGAPEIVDLSKTFNKMTSALNDYMAGLKKEIEEREKTESELQTARKIQEALVPSATELFQNKEFSLHAGMLPAHFVAGDFYDYFYVAKDKLAILVGDVSGKGVSSAFYMTIVRSIVRDTCQMESSDPAKAVTKINEILYKEYRVDMFVSLVLIYYEVLTGNVQYVNAGHPEILVMDENGICKEIARNEGLIMAFGENSVYKSVSFTMGSGETIVLYSDGILETYNDDLCYFRNDLKELVNKYYYMSVNMLTKKVLEAVDHHKGEQRDDDFTVLVFRREKMLKL